MPTSTSNISFDEIKSGNLASYERLFKALYGSLVNYAYKFVGRKEIAEEIVLDIFAYLWEKRLKIDIRTSLDSYLYMAVKNKCLNYIKLELPKLQAQVELTEVIEDISSNHKNHESSELLKKYVRSAIESLPEKCREIFLLSRYGGLTYKEIAEDLNISVKTVENQMSIALGKLRSILKPIMNKLNE